MEKIYSDAKGREIVMKFINDGYMATYDKNNKEVKQMEEQSNWRQEVSDSSAQTIKIADGETIQFVFLDEGESRTHTDYGKSVVFNVGLKEDGKDVQKNWFVNANNFDCLKQIKEIGELTGKTVNVSRTGSKKSDTRYKVEEVV